MVAFELVATVAFLTQIDLAAQQPAGQRGARTVAPFDPTGYWVPLITEDWRFRMVTPPKGDYASVPLNPEGRRVADTWDVAKDDASGNQCKAFGVGGILRQPGRLHITWQDDSTLKLDFEAGQQSRLLRFAAGQPAGERTWQGNSVAEWDLPAGGGRGGGGGGARGAGGGGGGGAAAPGNAAGAVGRGITVTGQRGALKVTTTGMREGYLRKNGVTYSESAMITEFIDRLGPEPDGAVYLLVRMTVEDPKYLQQPFVTSTHYRLEADGASRWNPAACKTDPPAK